MGGIHSSDSSGGSASTSGAPPGASGASSAGPTEENLIKGDLARMLGIHGRSQEVFGHNIPLVYLLVGIGLAFLWISGQMNAIRMLVMAFMAYLMYTQYQKSQKASGGGGTGDDGSSGDGGSSGGHVINRGGRK